MVMKYRVWHIKEKRYLGKTDGAFSTPAGRVFNCYYVDITDEVIVEWGVEENGVDYYVGDIIMADYGDYIIKFKNGCIIAQNTKIYDLHINLFDIDKDYCEIIGTIHDKELE